MGILWRYFAGRFAVFILAAFMVCCVLIFFIDLVELLRQSSRAEGVSMLSLIGIALLRVPSFAELTLPFAVLIGAIGAFLSLSRTSELTVVRAAGISVWQFLRPALMVALFLGIVSTTLYNPLAASGKALAERLVGELLGREARSLMREDRAAWLRQDGADGQSIIYARAVADRGATLNGVTVLQFDRNRKFLERIEAQKARLMDGYWALEKVNVSSPDSLPSSYDRYTISTYLKPEQVTSSIASVRGVSFWEMPQFIEFAKRAGLETERYELEYNSLLARPLLLVVMVLLGATCSLRAFRFGRIQTMVITGLSAGFGFFIFAELSRKIGASGVVSPDLAAWVPIIVAGLLASSVLLHQEDG